MQHARITVIMVSNMHSCHSTETMPWLVILTDQSTSLLSPCALLKSSCSQRTLRHEKAVDVATMSISQSVRRSDPQSILLRGQKREVFCTFRNLSFDRSTTEYKPLYLTSFTGKKSSQSQGKGHCQLLPKDWKTASHALTGDPLAPQQPPVAMGRHYAYAPFNLTTDNNYRCVAFYKGRNTCSWESSAAHIPLTSPFGFLKIADQLIPVPYKWGWMRKLKATKPST